MSMLIGHLWTRGGLHQFAIPLTDEDALEVKHVIDTLTTKASTLVPAPIPPEPPTEEPKP